MMDSVDDATSALLREYGFDRELFNSLRASLRTEQNLSERNRISGAVTPPEPDDVSAIPELGSSDREELHAVGASAIAEGRVGVVILAGGMATRFGGVVKATVQALDGQSFLDLKLRDAEQATKRYSGVVPAFVMTSFATHAEISAAIASRNATSSGSNPATPFPQFISLRLTPEGELFRNSDGRPSPYAPGHGDLTFALRAHGALEQFRRSGGTTLFVSNVDNLTATLDPAIVGAHMRGGAAMTVEVAPKHDGDRGGIPARVNGRPEIVEAFRLPDSFDGDSVRVFNTNTMVLDAEAIDRDFDLSWFAVNKKVEGATAVQFEHLVGQLSAFVPTTFVQVARTGPDARFQPVKDPQELDARQDEIRQALIARGILG